MAKYNKGDTSPEVRKLSDDITLSILEKTKLIKQATGFDPIPDYIPLNKNKTKLNMGDVHAWESEALGIVKYAYNTANTDKNREYLIGLKTAVFNFNHTLSKLQAKNSNPSKLSSSGYKTRGELAEEVKRLNSEINTLDREIVEIFRAYNQLRTFITTHRFDNKKYHEILKQQTQTKNNKLRSIK